MKKRSEDAQPNYIIKMVGIVLGFGRNSSSFAAASLVLIFLSVILEKIKKR